LICNFLCLQDQVRCPYYLSLTDQSAAVETRYFHTHSMILRNDETTRPSVQRGDWLRAKPRWSSIKLKFYTKSPYESQCSTVCVDTFPSVEVHYSSWFFQSGMYIGPVHDVCHKHTDFVAVLVPHIQTKELCWMNVWGFHTDYASVVNTSELAEWFRHGFSNIFLTELPPTPSTLEVVPLGSIHSVNDSARFLDFPITTTPKRARPGQKKRRRFLTAIRGISSTHRANSSSGS